MQKELKYLISIDIDGTIIKHDGTLTEKTKIMMNNLIEQGHMIILATGRRYTHAISIYEQLNLNTPLITESGARIDHPKDAMFKSYEITFDLHLYQAFLNQIKPIIKCIFYTVNDISYGFQFDQKMVMDSIGFFIEKVHEIHFHGQPLPYGMMVYVERKNHHHFLNIVAKEFESSIGLRSWGHYQDTLIYEVFLKQVSKASAVQYLLDLYQIPNKRWISFGDSSNDIEMLAQANFGIAMKNAEESVKAYAKEVTAYTNDEDGVVEYLIQFFNMNT
jgi:5-amino-6-(5-phospho-D-ribitylamino)uracil phosphatase